MKKELNEVIARMEAPERVKMVEKFVEEVNINTIFNNSSHMIDLGCGTGLVGLQFAHKVAKLTMIDSSSIMIDILTEKVTRNTLDNINIISGELNDYCGEAVDGIVAFLVAHHIENTNELFAQAYSVLRSNGLFIIGDILSEDGSFHKDMLVPHNGFDLDEISKIAVKNKFHSIKTYQYDTVYKNGRDYPLFILIAKK